MYLLEAAKKDSEASGEETVAKEKLPGSELKRIVKSRMFLLNLFHFGMLQMRVQFFNASLNSFLSDLFSNDVEKGN